MRFVAPLIAIACGVPTPEEPTLADNFGIEETRGQPGCDNLLEDCLLPFPSEVYIDRSGERPAVRLPAAGMPVTVNGDPLTTEPLQARSAFGTASPVLFRLPGAVVPELTVFDPAPSLEHDSPTVLVDAETGERIPHWLETDFFTDGAEPTLFTLRPSVPLPRGHRVVVGIRDFVDADGVAVEAAEGFVALRDRRASRQIGVHERREHFEAVVFPALESAGVGREELQLAWSFSVATAEDATAPMVEMRDAAFGALAAGGPEFTIDELLVCEGEPLPEGCHEAIRFIVDGTVEVPSALGEEDATGMRRLVRDSSGSLDIVGTEARSFRLQVPHSAYEGEGPVPILQYGHGFLGSADEADNGWLRRMANRLGFVILSTSLQGMSDADSLTWTTVLLGNAGRFPELADEAMQGVVGQLVMQRLVRTSLADDAPTEILREDGSLPWDRDEVWYYGNSQGGSVGTIMMATSLDVERGVLGVPGSGYPLLLHRSTVFAPLAEVIRGSVPGPDSISIFLAMLGTGFDHFEPLSFAPHMHGSPLPGTPAHEVLLHVAKEDQQVNNELSFQLGRASGAVLMAPAVRDVWGLELQSFPAQPGVGLVEVDFSIPDDPTPLDPPPERVELPSGGDTHGWLRSWEPAQDQMVHFLATGELIDVCDGVPCVVDGKP